MYTRTMASAFGRATLRGVRRHWVAISVPIAIVLLIVYTVAFLLDHDEPLRRYTEAKMNRALKGYSAHIETLDFHPLGFSLDLKSLTVTQDAHPDPAVLRIERLSASVHWRALLSGQLVADVEIEKPTVYVNLPQASKEISDPTPIKERGWQDALEAVYPLKINHFEIRDGDVMYVDQGPYKPLRLRDLDLVATNIRRSTIRSRRSTSRSSARCTSGSSAASRSSSRIAPAKRSRRRPRWKGGSITRTSASWTS